MKKKLTPAMDQYYTMRRKCPPNTILFFQMGDFFETFDEDAKICSKTLEIVLTSRSMGKDREKMPLAGFPVKSLETHLNKMIGAGYKVAVCEQVEKAVPGRTVKRDITRIITPGTIYESSLINESTNNYLLSISINEAQKRIGVSFLDISTGDFYVSDFSSKLIDSITNILEKFSPKEIILPDIRVKNKSIRYQIEEYIKSNTACYITTVNETFFNIETARKNLLDHFEVTSLIGFGIEESPLAIIAAGSLISYLKTLNDDFSRNIRFLKQWKENSYLSMDANTLRNLEILQNIFDHSSSGSLYSVFTDFIKTSFGSRLLRFFITNPLLDKEAIENRLNSVNDFIQAPLLIEELQDLLKSTYDLQRLLAKVNFKSSMPRDLIAIKNTLVIANSIYESLSDNKEKFSNEIVSAILSFNFDNILQIIHLITESIVDEPPTTIKEGGLIKPSYNTELDSLMNIKNNQDITLKNIEEREKQRVPFNLKVGYNSVHGFYIEITKAQIREYGEDKIPIEYKRRQTLRNAERYITPELKDLEEKILTIDEKISDLEYNLFCEVRDKLSNYSSVISEISELLAILDVTLCFSSISLFNKYTRPSFSDDNTLNFINGRHPVIEKMSHTERFVPNDINMSSGELQIITGSNMSGKSTFIRQTALIVIMGQMGCFVPAEKCSFGIVDKIFSRIGALDRLALGQSTFMMEMLETTYILNNATSNSLIILDEVGRGTGTFDGVSLAYSIARFLIDKIKAKTLFATHYHILSELDKEFPSKVKNFHMTAIERNNDLILLYKIEPGSTDHSFGIHVAKMAGLPHEVIIGAQKKLIELEDNEIRTYEKTTSTTKNKSRQMTLDDLFKKSSQNDNEKKIKELRNEILAFYNTYSDVDVNHITPIESLKVLKDILDNLRKFIDRIERN